MEVDHIVPVEGMGELLYRLVSEMPEVINLDVPEDLKLEAQIAERVMGTVEEVEKLGHKSPISCPDCGGGLWEIKNSSLLRYRCHLGHSFLADTLLNGMNAALEETLWVALRMLEERKTLLMGLSEKGRGKGQEIWADTQRERAEDMRTHINRIREILLNPQNRVNPDAPDLKMNASE